MGKKELLIGLAPTRRNVFSKEEAGRYKKLIETRLQSWGVRFINLDWLNDEGLLYDELDAPRVAQRFLAEGVDAVFAPHCNFGTEGAVGLLARAVGKPFLLWGPRDDAPLADGTRTRDTQCGLFATSKVLRRMGVPFTYVINSTVDSPEFERGFKAFLGAAAAANAFLGARVGQVDTRPSAFWTVMVNEGELMERWGIRVVPTTLVDVEQGVKKLMADPTPMLRDSAADLARRIDFGKLPPEGVLKFAALKQWLLEWAEREALDAIAIQCWDAIQLALGLYPCIADSELTGMGLPVACETDVHGALTALMAQAAVHYATPIFFADLTIRNPENENSELLWHCGPFPILLARPDSPRRVSDNYIAQNGLYGVAEWQIKGGEVTLARLDGDHGQYSLLMGHARGTKGPYTRGTYLWVEMDNWPKWEQKLIYGPYIHHIVGVHARVAPILAEACKYIPGLTPDPVEPNAEEIAAFWRGEEI